jgi:hypothetical protein
LNLLHQHVQAEEIPVYAEVVEVTHEPPCERGMLRLDRLVPMAATPVGGGLEGSPHARVARLEARESYVAWLSREPARTSVMRCGISRRSSG